MGAGLMCFLGPGSSQRNFRAKRRARQRAHSTLRLWRRRWHLAGDHAAGATRELVGRLRSHWTAASAVPDEVLVDRVRAKIGHVVRNAAQVSVLARQGYVTLVGHVEEHEVLPLCKAVAAIPGVVYVENRCAGPNITKPAPGEILPAGSDAS